MSSMRWILRRGRGIDSALILVVIPSYTHTFTSRHGIRSDMAPGQSWYDVAGAQRDSQNADANPLLEVPEGGLTLSDLLVEPVRITCRCICFWGTL